MRSGRSLFLSNQNDRQVIITGQSLALAILNVPEALKFYLPGWTVYNGSVGSTYYTDLKTGTVPFANSVQHGGSVILCIHGESDAAAPTDPIVYKQNLIDWRNDYASAMANPNLMFLLDQMSSKGYDYDNNSSVYPSHLIHYSQYHAGLDNTADKIFLAGPKYQYQYETVALQPSGAPYVHMTSDSYSWLGQKYAQIIGRLVNTGDWKPLYPTGISRTGAVITITCNVPVPPLAIDTTTVSARTNRGFVYEDSTSSATISSVTVGTNTITITLNTTPTGSTKIIRYAYWPNHPTLSPLSIGSRGYAIGGMIAGNIRDSDTFAQYVSGTGPWNGGNWLVHFTLDVP
jgi:hypothetical protein